MYLEMTTDEFKELRKIIIGIDNSEITKHFNKIFTGPKDRRVKGYVHPVSKNICIDIDEELALHILMVFVKHSSSIGKNLKDGLGIGTGIKWINILKSIDSDLSKL